MRIQSNRQLRILFCSSIFVLLSFFSFAQVHTVTSFAPANAGSNETVTITGTNFSSITAVRFGGTSAQSFTVVSPTTIRAVVAAGTSGSVTVTKTGFGDISRAGFTFSAIPTVTRMITDFGYFWNTNTTVNSNITPNDAHNLLAYTYGGITYSTGVNNDALSANGIAYTATNFKALPAIMNGTTSGASLFIVAASKIDGNTSAGLYTHPDIKDLTIQSVLSDGPNGLNIGTGYTNLPLGATSNFNINGIQVAKAGDNEPDLVITQIADPSTSAFDTYKFLDAANNTVGNQLQIDLSKLSPLGTYYLDLFTVAAGIPFSTAKPTGISSANTSRQIRLMAFKLSDFGITPANYSQVKRLQIIPSGVTDMAFVAYNTATINVPPSIAQDIQGTSSAICNPGGGSAHLAVNATDASGGTLSYDWEVSTNGGTSWLPVVNGGIYSGATTTALNISSATVGYQYRANVTESGSGYSSTSPVFTITAIASTALAGTLDPAGFTNCLNSVSGTTSLTVTPTGGTGSYSYQWSSSTTPAGTYTNIPGAIYNSYSPPLDAVSTIYYKVLITSGCINRLSAATQVVINGADITDITNGSSCTTGSVTLSATATGGTINWYAAATGGGSLGSGPTFNTPSISATTTYYAGTTSGSCASTRVPVVATIINTISLSASNFSITYASNVCSGAGSDVTITSSVLIDGIYTIQYNIAGANSISGATSSVTISGGSGTFTTSPLFNAGANTITISGVRIGSCTITPSSGNTIGFNVNAGSPVVSNFNITVANGCSNEGSIATVSSSTLTSGTYIVTYNVSGSNTLTGETSQMVFTAGAPGTGNFTLPVLNNQGTNTITITSIALLSSPDCSSAMNAGSPAFLSNTAAAVDAGTPKTMCASDISTNITGGSFADNYTTLVWSTSNGTGTFTNNTTAAALTGTTYTPDAADISRGSAFMTLTATPASGCAPISKTIILTINAATLGGTVTADQTIPAGSQPADLTLTGYTGNIVKWQRATDPAFTVATDIANTSNILTGATIGPLTNTTYFRAVLQSGTCNPVNSLYATINISSLPVSLLYFSQRCEGSNVWLQWATASELNNSYFTIERSADAVNWYAIKTIAGAGNSNTTLTYHFTDSTATGTNFYRLKQTDLDGRSSFSDVINSSCGNTATTFGISPNPGKNIVVISGLPAKGSLRITDNKGREVVPFKTYTGTAYSINIEKFATGIYYVSVYSGGKITTKKLLKQ